MNKLIATLMFLTLITGCVETNKKETKSKTTIEEHKNEKKEIESDYLNNNWLEDIQLNNGIKWNANIETTQGVNMMLEEIKKSSPKTVQEYVSLANKLNTEKNMIVEKCTMKGESHDNLHIFLHPLIEKINHLQKVTTMKDGMEITNSIIENLEAYTYYFK
jgi:hypothetical protein